MCYIFHKGDFLPHKSIVGYSAPGRCRANWQADLTGLDLLAEPVQL